MTLINRLLQQLFPANEIEENPLKEVLVREMIKRNQVFLDEYELWKEAKLNEEMIAQIQAARTARDENPTASINYYRHAENMSNGFYVQASAEWNTTDYSFLVQWFIDKIITLDYYVNNATREAVVENGELTTVEMFYLKPKLKYRMEMPYNQLFGNIIIEHIIKDEQSSLVKLMANVYSDRNFKDPYNFEDLLNELLLA